MSGSTGHSAGRFGTDWGGRKIAVGRQDQRRALAVVDRRIVSPYEAKSLGESSEKPLVEIPNAVLVIVVLGARAPLSEGCQQNQCEHAGPCVVSRVLAAERLPYHGALPA